MQKVNQIKSLLSLKQGEASSGAPKWLSYLRQLFLCLVISLLLGSIITLLNGENPLTVYASLLQQAFTTPLGLMIAIQRATPYIITSGAAVLAFQGGAINMGLDGQFTVGAAVAAVAGAALPPLPKVITIPIILVLCGLGGAAAGFIPAIFKRISGINEVITGMIANMIIPSLISAFFSLPLLRLAASQARHGVQPWAQFSQFVELSNGGWGLGTKANTGIFAAVGIIILLAIWLKRTRLGFEIRMTSANFSFAEFAGIRAGRSFILTMMLSGAIAAMAGATEILGVWRTYSMGTLLVGNKGLVLALAGGNTFIGALIASFLYGGLESGAMNASWATAIPRPLIDVLVEILVISAAIPSMRMFFSGSSFSDVERLGGRFLTRQEK